MNWKSWVAAAMLSLTLFAVAAEVTGIADLESIQKMLKSKKSIVWVFTGDSITHGALHTHGYRSYPEVFQERVRYEMWRPQDIVINTGISGDIVKNILKDYDQRIGQFNPSVVSVKIGMNDCKKVTTQDFKRDLTALTQRIRADSAIVILQTTNTVWQDSPLTEKLTPFIVAVREVAKEQNTILIDNYAKWEKEAKGDWFNNNAHPNGRGHMELAKEVLKVLKMDGNGKAPCLNIKFKP